MSPFKTFHSNHPLYKKIFLPVIILAFSMLACSLPFLNNSSDPTATAPAPQSAATATTQPTDIPVVNIVPPAGILVRQDLANVQLINLQGGLLDEIDIQTLGEYFSPSAIAGNSPDGSSLPPMILHDGWDGTKQYYDNGSMQPLTWDAATEPVLAPGTIYLAITRIIYKDSGIGSELYVSSGAQLAAAEPVLTNDDSGEEWLVPTPLYLKTENGQPVGVWYTLALTGMGGDIVFPLQHSLYYLDLNSGQTREVLGSQYSPNSISQDGKWAALTDFESDTPFLTAYNLDDGQTFTLPLDPTSDRGAGYASIAPDGSKAAWMEAGGTWMSLEPDFSAHLKLSNLNGEILYDFDGQMIAGLIGAEYIYHIIPAAWLDANTLLIQANGGSDNGGQAAMLKLDTNTGSIELFYRGVFMSMVYQGQNPQPVGGQVQEQPANPAAVPSAALSSTGPWVALPALEHLWAVNPDGSGMTPFINQASLSWYVQEVAAAPQGGYLAFTAAWDPDNLQGLTLFLAKLPDMTTVTITELSSVATTPPLNPQVCDPNYEAARAATMNGLAWSPDGRQLAFIGAQSGPTADLYVYSLDTDEIVQVTDGPSQAYNPVWSPDGKYIIHFGANCFGTGAGFDMAGVWAVSPDGVDVFSLYTVDPESAGEGVVGWLNNNEVVVETMSGCPGKNLRKVNLSTKSVTGIFQGCYWDAVMADDGTIALTLEESMAADGKSGLFIFPSSGGAAIHNPDFSGYGLSYSPEYGSFFMVTDEYKARAFDFNAQPGLLIDIEGIPVFSPGGSWWAAATLNGLVVGGEASSGESNIFSGYVLHLFWALDPQSGQTALFFYGGDSYDNMSLYVTYPPVFKPFVLAQSANPSWYSSPQEILP